MNNYDTYTQNLKEIADYKYATAALEWDKETYMPKGGAEQRSRQIATLTTAAHRLFTSSSMGDLLDSLLQDDNLSFVQKRNVAQTHREYQKSIALSADFVNKKSLAISKGYQSWIAAREQNDYKIYQADLERIVQLQIEETDIIGYNDHPYNAPLDHYENGMTVTFLDDFFNKIISPIRSLLKRINKVDQIDNKFLFNHYPKDKQWNFGMQVLRDIGYDFNRGRQDISTHPFSTAFGPDDVRITSRIDEHNYADMLWSTIHEGGHALYEQGLPSGDHYGLPSGGYISLGIHESQSRLWENHVGRSAQFWDHYYEPLQKVFPDHLSTVDPKHFYKSINKIEPNLIRTDSDELHYHIHVYIRYELEKQLIKGELSTSELNEAWNDMYAEHMNVSVPNDKEGILQDIHWALGSIGYFPTYSLGTFYAAQFYDAAVKKHPEIESDMQSGQFSTLLTFLRTQIHQHGQLYSADQICKNVTGESLNPAYFLKYAEQKFGKIYGI